MEFEIFFNKKVEVEIGILEYSLKIENDFWSGQWKKSLPADNEKENKFIIKKATRNGVTFMNLFGHTIYFWTPQKWNKITQRKLYMEGDELSFSEEILQEIFEKQIKIPVLITADKNKEVLAVGELGFFNTSLVNFLEIPVFAGKVISVKAKITVIETED